MTTLRQLRLIVLGATLGAIVGSLAFIGREDLRPAAFAAIAGAAVLALTFAIARLPFPSLALRYARRIAQLGITLVAVAAVVAVLSMLASPEARVIRSRPAQESATAEPTPAAAPADARTNAPAPTSAPTPTQTQEQPQQPA